MKTITGEGFQHSLHDSKPIGSFLDYLDEYGECIRMRYTFMCYWTQIWTTCEDIMLTQVRVENYARKQMRWYIIKVSWDYLQWSEGGEQEHFSKVFPVNEWRRAARDHGRGLKCEEHVANPGGRNSRMCSPRLLCYSHWTYTSSPYQQLLLPGTSERNQHPSDIVLTYECSWELGKTEEIHLNYRGDLLRAKPALRRETVLLITQPARWNSIRQSFYSRKMEYQRYPHRPV